MLDAAGSDWAYVPHLYAHQGKQSNSRAHRLHYEPMVHYARGFGVDVDISEDENDHDTDDDDDDDDDDDEKEDHDDDHDDDDYAPCARKSKGDGDREDNQRSDQDGETGELKRRPRSADSIGEASDKEGFDDVMPNPKKRRKLETNAERSKRGKAADAVDLPEMAKTQLRFQNDNPKRARTATYSRYEKYKKAQTVGEFYHMHPDATNAKADLTWDLSKGLCSVVSK